MGFILFLYVLCVLYALCVLYVLYYVFYMFLCFICFICFYVLYMFYVFYVIVIWFYIVLKTVFNLFRVNVEMVLQISPFRFFFQLSINFSLHLYYILTELEYVLNFFTNDGSDYN